MERQGEEEDVAAWEKEGSVMRRVQMGLAKKIKNGARKIVLDQAEEARIAAFSTFKSLGVDIPKGSCPLLSSLAGDSPIQGDCFEDKINTNSEVAGGTAVDGTNVMHDRPLDITSETFTVTSSMRGKAVEKVCSVVGERDGSKLSVDKSVLNPSSASIYRPGKLQNIEHEPSRAACYTEVRVGCDSEILDKKLAPNQKEHEIGSRNGSGYSNNKDSAQGPTNASNFPGGFDSFLDHWEAEKEFYFDVHFSIRSELNSPILFEVLGLAVCWENSTVYYVNLSKDLFSSSKLNTCNVVSNCSTNDTTKDLSIRVMWDAAKNRWSRIAKIMGQNGVRKITWNLKSQIQVLKLPSISVHQLGRLDHKEVDLVKLIDNSYILLTPISVHDGIDMCLVAWILWPDEESKSSPNLEKVVKKRLSSEAAAAANRCGRWRNQMRKAAHDGCCRRVAQLRALGSILLKLLISENLVEALTRIENPLVKVLAEMELWGIGVDMEGCIRARQLLVRKLKELEKEAHNLAGMPFSLNTTADIADLLYTRLKLPVPHGCKKGKLHPSTDKHSLDLLRGQHPVVLVIREHRTLVKLNGTLGSICSRARLCMKSQKYIVKGHWLQSSTATGRLSMEEPNLQCVEHSVIFTTHHSENNSPSPQRSHHQINARDFFTPTQESWLLLTADYSQIELRLMAHFSKDSSLIELLSKPDGDCFTMIAAKWTGKLESTINSYERDQTKRLVYGILYGMGSNSLAEQLECSSEEAADKIQSFKTSFPGVSAWLQEAVASCRHKGYIETLFGRKRFLSNIKLGNNKEKAKAQRQAVNSICQGSAADIIKIAMITIHTVIAEGNESPEMNVHLAARFSMLKGHCRIILQVHDELVLEVDPCFVKEAGLLLKTSMENAASLLVPLHVKLKVGRTWGSLETFQPES